MTTDSIETSEDMARPLPAGTVPGMTSIATAEHWLEKAHVAMAALRELVACKDLKDEAERITIGFLRQRGQSDEEFIAAHAAMVKRTKALDAEYARRKPPAWAAARAVLSGEIAAPSAAIADVVAERARQISVEGWTNEHDDAHMPGALACAGGCYALHAGARSSWDQSSYRAAEPLYQNDEAGTYPWPWGAEWWKPKTPRRDLVRAAALLIAEIERMDRHPEQSYAAKQSDGIEP